MLAIVAKAWFAPIVVASVWVATLSAAASMRGKAERLAYAAVGAAVALLGVVLSYYVKVLSFSFNLLAVLGIVMPLLKKYYREAALAVISVILIGFFWVNIKIIPFILVGGTYTVITVFCADKNWNRWLLLVLKALYSCLVFFLMYQIFSVITLDLAALKLDKLQPAVLYLILNGLFSIAFLVYDTVLLQGIKFLRYQLRSFLK